MVSTLSRTNNTSIATTRILGYSGALGSPLLALTSVLSQGDNSTSIAAWLGLGFLLSVLCTVIGMRRLRITGTGTAATALFRIQIAGLTLAAGQQVQDGLLVNPSANGLIYTITDLAWPFGMCLWLIVFLFIVKARVWRGWRRWPALLVGVSLPAFLTLMAVAGREKSGPVFIVPITLGFLLLGLAVATDTRTDA